jgi:hypothetical protein
MGEPFLCRLGFHKWQNYGNEVQVFWNSSFQKGFIGAYGTIHKVHSQVVYEKCVCKRCGIKLRRKFATNSDRTLSCVGWEPDAEETERE